MLAYFGKKQWKLFICIFRSQILY